MSFSHHSVSSPPRREVNAASIQSAFRDVTNQYLSANKENVPPVGLQYGLYGSSGKGLGCGLASPNTRSSVLAEPERNCCGTPVQTELVVESRRGEDEPAPIVEESYEESPCTGHRPPQSFSSRMALGAAPPNAQRTFDTAVAACGTSVGESRTPGHPAPPPSSYSSGFGAAATTAAKLLQQRHRSLGTTQSTWSGGGGGTPFNLQGGNAPATGFTVDSPFSGASSLHCTPSGARRSAAAAVRAPSETPTRLDDISFYLNNSFESGSESPTLDATAGGVYAATRTPCRSFDLQQAVEEMLRGCLDGSTPARRSDASGLSPSGSRKRQQQQQHQQTLTMDMPPVDVSAAAIAADSTQPSNAFAPLDAIFAAPSLSKAAATDAVPWGDSASAAAAGTCLRTPERFVQQHNVFAESDDEGSHTSPQSDANTRGMPAAGVRRDPLVHFSTAANPGSATTYYDAAALDDNPYRAVAKVETTEGDGVMRALALPTVSSVRHPGAIEFRSESGHSGPDMLAMLAAAVQQQQQQQHSPRSAMGSAELDSQTFSDGEREWRAPSAVPPTPPPSYEEKQQPLASRSGRRDGAPPLVVGGAVAAQAPQPTRRSHHLPQVKAAAGSLIAVSGRRVPVDKLHLLSLSSGEENNAAGIPATSPMAAAGSVGTRQGGRGSVQSPPTPQNHVEGPSMRRVPKRSVVTFTRGAPNTGATSGRTASAFHAQGGLRGVPSATASPRSSSSHASLSEAGAHRTAATTTTRLSVAGPSARRVPPSVLTSSAAHSRQSSMAASLDGSGVRQSSEQDVVAVLQFSKGQTMRFVANLSASALETTRVALMRDVRSAGSGKAERVAEVSLLQLTQSPLSFVEVGKSYLAHVYGDQSPYENVPFQDVGVCVRLYTAAGEQQHRDHHVNGVLLREVDVVGDAEDRWQHEQALQQQTAAYIECERQFKFSSLPFQLESIYFTFDASIGVVFYRVVAADAQAPSVSHRFSNTSRVVRELQFHLGCRVFLKQC